MALISETINSIEQNAQLLIKKLKHLEDENALLLEKNTELAEQNKTIQTNLLVKNSKIGRFKKQITAQEDDGTEGLEQNKNLRTEIDQYILEIDKCIEWLQNQGQ